MVSFCFSFSGEYWPIHRYEVMIRSRRNERARRRIKIGRRHDNFRSWTKEFVRKKKKKRKKKNTMKQDLCPVETVASRFPTQSPITPSSSAATSSTFFFFFLLLFLFSIDGDHPIMPFFRWILLLSVLCVLFLSCVTPFEFWIPKSLTWHALEWWKVLNF